VALVADYVLLAVEPFALAADVATLKEIPVELPPGFHGGSRAILSYVIDTAGSRIDLAVEVEVNNEFVHTIHFSQDGAHSMHVVLPERAFRTQGPHELRFRLKDNSLGEARISQVVLVCRVSA
jgi:hypothetical protein